jgi:23S rRNA (uracil1939-C5)-methyltransferase
VTAIVFVESLGQQGDGIVHVDGATVHVPKTLPGDRILLVDSKLKQIVERSHDRIEPFCQYFSSCGGCKLQHVRAKPYAEWKRQLLVDALARQGLETEIKPLVDAHGRGRRRVVLHVREIDGIWRAGFMEAKSHHLTAIHTCPVLVPELASATRIAAEFGLPLGPCDVSITSANNGLDVAVKAEREAVARRLPSLQLLFRDSGILRLSVNGETLFAQNAPIVGFGGADVRLPIGSFLQVTAEGESALAILVAGALRKSKRIADLFCGLGPFAFRLAKQATIHAADSEKPAIAALQEAARRTQGLKPISVEVRDLFRNPLVAQELNEFDGVVLDPPRAGAEAQCRQIAKSKVKRAAYVSCDVSTFARDAKLLVEGGYKLRQVTPVDQFKWTAHLEMVGVFER